jgi:tetratricopeptide (TPR) repeat protein
MQDVLKTAVDLHQAGKLAAAAQLYEKVLEAEPNNVAAMHLLGVLHHQRGDHAEAIALISRAVTARPNDPVYHANLAEAYRAVGDFDRAIGCCQAALRFWPNYPEALCNLGTVLQAKGKHAEAIDYFRRALAARPEFATAHNNLGNALRELGNAEEAIAHFKQAVELNPEFATARSNLGQMLLDRGQAQEALLHCQEAVRLQANVASLHHNLGNTLRSLERYADARAAYLEALRLDPNLALAHAHLGLVLQSEGQFSAALPWFKQAIELDRSNANFWQYLAELYDDLEESALAIPCWEQVLKLAPNRIAARLSLGWAIQEEGRLEEAEDHYRTILKQKADHAGAQLNIGGVHEERGELKLAEAAFRDALKLQPAFATPHARLATLLRGKLPESDRVALEQRLTDAKLSTDSRARLLFAMAQVLDANGEYSRAAECLNEANSLALELARGRREYAPADHQRFVETMQVRYDRAFFEKTRNSGSETRRPVFIVGLPRSGTTLIEQILASHSAVHGAGELRLVRRTFEAIPTACGLPRLPLDCVSEVDAATWRQLADQHLEKLREIDGGRFGRVVDKMPDNYLYLGLLSVLFPKAAVIHCVRDLRDTAVSCWMTDFRSIRWANDPQHIADRFRLYRQIMDHWRTVLPTSFQEVCYEEAVTDLESVARRLVAACDLEWEPACLEFHRTRRPIRTASVIQARQPIYTQSVGRWKNYEFALADLFAALPQ